NFVAQNDNFRELPELVRLLAPLKIFFLGVNPLHHFTLEPGAYADYYEEFRLGKVPRAEFDAVLAEARAEAQKAGIPFDCYVNPDFEWPAGAPSVEAASRLHVHPPNEAAGAEPAPEPALEAAPAPPSSAPALEPMYCHYPWTTLYL